jgi:uncharacterized protein YkwD
MVKTLSLCVLVGGVVVGLGLAGSATMRAFAGDVSSADVVVAESRPDDGVIASESPLITSSASGVPVSTPTSTGSSTASGSLAPPTAGSAPPTASPGRPEEAPLLVASDVMLRLNGERESAGLSTLIVDAELSRRAAEWAETMAVRGYTHSPKERLAEIIVLIDAGAVGENIHAPEPQCGALVGCAVADLQPTSGVLHVDWMRSARHRDALLEPRWDRAGAGVFCDERGRMWAVVLFASPTGVRVDPPAATAYREPAIADNSGVTCQGVSRAHSDSWTHPTPS